MYEIRNGFTNYRGEYFDNIREINFTRESNGCFKFGTFIKDTVYNKDQTKFYSDGIHLYKSPYDENIGIRIFEDWALYKYTYHFDDKFISELQRRQKNIKLTEFPTGVVTIENKIVGQEIPLYNDSIALLEYLEANRDVIPTTYYLEVIKILKELFENGIIYNDVHPKNFLINNSTKEMKLIDFDSALVKFEPYGMSMLTNLKYMINKLNEMCDISFSDKLKKAETLDQIEDCVKEENYKLLKK